MWARVCWRHSARKAKIFIQFLGMKKKLGHFPWVSRKKVNHQSLIFKDKHKLMRKIVKKARNQQLQSQEFRKQKNLMNAKNPHRQMNRMEIDNVLLSWNHHHYYYEFISVTMFQYECRRFSTWKFHLKIGFEAFVLNTYLMSVPYALVGAPCGRAVEGWNVWNCIAVYRFLCNPIRSIIITGMCMCICEISSSINSNERHRKIRNWTDFKSHFILMGYCSIKCFAVVVFSSIYFH